MADGFYWARHIETGMLTIIYVNNLRYEALGMRQSWDGRSMDDLRAHFVVLNKIAEPV